MVWVHSCALRLWMLAASCTAMIFRRLFTTGLEVHAVGGKDFVYKVCVLF